MSKNIKDEILGYFNSEYIGNSKRSYRTGVLNVLDNNYKEYYTGVSLQYIVYDLLKAKYKKSKVCLALSELIEEDELKAIYCPDVEKIVFESLIMSHRPYYQSSKAKVLDYLNKFIKN